MHAIITYLEQWSHEVRTLQNTKHNQWSTTLLNLPHKVSTNWILPLHLLNRFLGTGDDNILMIWTRWRISGAIVYAHSHSHYSRNCSRWPSVWSARNDSSTNTIRAHNISETHESPIRHRRNWLIVRHCCALQHSSIVDTHAHVGYFQVEQGVLFLSNFN